MDEKGVWRTINGAHVFIRDGESAEEAMARQFGESKPKSESRVAVLQYLDQLDDIDFTDPNLTSTDILNQLGIGKGTYLEMAMRDELAERFAQFEDEATEKIIKSIPKLKTTFVEEVSIGTNREGYEKSKAAATKLRSQEYRAYTTNCQRCAQAFTLRWVHGLDVTAKPRDFGDGDTVLHLEGWNSAIYNRDDYYKNFMSATDINKTIGRTSASTTLQHKAITKIVKQAGPGACFQCAVAWRKHTTRGGEEWTTRGDPGAHVFNIVNDNGEVKFIDAQTGGDASEYFKPDRIPGIRPSKTSLVRVDNCRLVGRNFDLVCNYEKEDK